MRYEKQTYRTLLMLMLMLMLLLFHFLLCFVVVFQYLSIAEGRDPKMIEKSQETQQCPRNKQQEEQNIKKVVGKNSKRNKPDKINDMGEGLLAGRNEFYGLTVF